MFICHNNKRQNVASVCARKFRQSTGSVLKSMGRLYCMVITWLHDLNILNITFKILKFVKYVPQSLFPVYAFLCWVILLPISCHSRTEKLPSATGFVIEHAWSLRPWPETNLSRSFQRHKWPWTKTCAFLTPFLQSFSCPFTLCDLFCSQC